MTVDVKVVRVYLWRFSVLFAGICFRFAQKHPRISGTLFSLFFLHVFFPLVFRLLIYSSPIMIFAYAYRKNVTKLQKKYDQTNDTKDDDNRSKHNGESECDIFEYEDDEETQDEDALEEMRKALEWTEQDERNLMELGTSETERDRRLESLIQKRRARKLQSVQVRNVVDIIRHGPNQVAPLVIARSTGPLNLISTLSDTDDLHMHGSAPSVLLPSRSPFDLPYDPFQEQQSSKQHLKSGSVTFKDSTESESSKTGKEEKCASKSVYADCCERPVTEGVSDSNRNLCSEDLSSYLHKSLASSIQETAAKEAKENGHVQAPLYISSKDLFNVHKRSLHTPAHSIASDLVVEVSEAGSPPPTLSPPDGDSSQYDGDIERDLSSGSDDMSMHVHRTEGQECIPEIVEMEHEVVSEYNELDGDSSKQETGSIEEIGSSVQEQGSSNVQVAAEDVRGNTEIRTADDVTLADEQQGQTIEEVPEVTSPKSVLPHTDLRDQITRLDSQQSDLADSVSDVTQVENSTSSISDSQNSQHLEIQDMRSSPSESNTQRGNEYKGLDQVTKSEAAAADACEVTEVVNESRASEKIEETVSTTTEGAEGNLVNLQGNNLATGELTIDENESAAGLNSAEALPLSDILNSDDEFNGMSEVSHDPDSKGGLSTAEEPSTTSVSDIDTQGVNLDDTSVKSLKPITKVDSQNEAPLPDMDTELHIHRITETCM